MISVSTRCDLIWNCDSDRKICYEIAPNYELIFYPPSIVVIAAILCSSFDCVNVLHLFFFRCVCDFSMLRCCLSQLHQTTPIVIGWICCLMGGAKNSHFEGMTTIRSIVISVSNSVFGVKQLQIISLDR